MVVYLSRLVFVERSHVFYAFDPCLKPAAIPKPGDLVFFETQDCFGGQIKSEEDTIEKVDFSRGMIHGDVKPGSVYIKGGVSKLGDFSSISNLVTLHSIRELPYTVGYRAFEQVYKEIAMRAREPGFENRLDIYQLGNTLLYTLTGEAIDGRKQQSGRWSRRN
jgi:hypothetical protein